MTPRKVAQSLVRRPLLAAALAASAVAPAPAMAAFDVFMKIDGVEGESTDPQHKGEIDISSFSWGMSQTGNNSGGGAGRAGKCSLNAVKLVDKASPLLFKNCATGEHIKDAILQVRTAPSRQAFLIVTLQNVVITSVQDTGASGDGGKPSESISISYEQVQYQYSVQSADGSLGVPVVATVNCPAASDR